MKFMRSVRGPKEEKLRGMKNLKTLSLQHFHTQTALTKEGEFPAKSSSISRPSSDRQTDGP